ncbi:hypothetical protein DZC76_08695 [Pseudomonas sp. phDV1]|nr:hypothetical protein DZC76_08695 [Pseudomonas sp. phDV1]
MLPHPATPPLSASCSSGQHFASGFLQIRSRPRHPCLWLTLPLAGCVEDFHLQVVQSTTTVNRTAPVTALRAMPGAQQQEGRSVTGLDGETCSRQSTTSLSRFLFRVASPIPLTSSSSSTDAKLP